jgi:hypothetical protein
MLSLLARWLRHYACRCINQLRETANSVLRGAASFMTILQGMRRAPGRSLLRRFSIGTRFLPGPARGNIAACDAAVKIFLKKTPPFGF